MAIATGGGLLRGAVAGAGLAVAAACALAQQAYPNHPLRLMIMVPGATPADIVARVHREIVKALGTPEVSGRFAAEGSEVIGSTPEEAATVLHRDMDMWADLIRRTGIRLQ